MMRSSNACALHCLAAFLKPFGLPIYAQTTTKIEKRRSNELNSEANSGLRRSGNGFRGLPLQPSHLVDPASCAWKADSMCGSIGNLSKSIKDLKDVYFVMPHLKQCLLNPSFPNRGPSTTYLFTLLLPSDLLCLSRQRSPAVACTCHVGNITDVVSVKCPSCPHHHKQKSGFHQSANRGDCLCERACEVYGYGRSGGVADDY